MLTIIVNKRIMCKRMDNEELHQLKRDLYHWAKETLRGTSVINTESGNIIEITSNIKSSTIHTFF